MAITSLSSVQSATSGLWVQIQQQLAQRNVAQAEQQASALRVKAQDAESVAEHARENARSLHVQANQAQGEARQARQGLATQKAGGDVQAQLTGLHEQIVQLVQPEAAVKATVPAPPSPVINAFGQSTGNLVNVTA